MSRSASGHQDRRSVVLGVLALVEAALFVLVVLFQQELARAFDALRLNLDRFF